jgi:hypothetical protein
LINFGKQNVDSLNLDKSNNVKEVKLEKKPVKEAKPKPPKKKKKDMTKAELYEYTFIDTPIYKKLTKNFFLYEEILMAMTFVTLVFQFLIAKTNPLFLLYILLLVMADFMFYPLFKNELDIKGGKKAYTMYLIHLPVTFSVLINHFLIEYITFSTVFLRIIMGLLTAAIILFYMVFMTQEAIREIFQNIKDSDITEQTKKMKDAYCNIDEEDAILGCAIDMTETDKNGHGVITDIPVVLPAKDRFLHMLILGPTGCGKTSQTIIPMIWRDISIKKLVNGKPVGITVLEPKGDLAEKVYAMVNYKNNEIDEAMQRGEYSPEKYGVKRTVVYFNPILNDCPYFNPLEGDESDVIENMCTTFNMLNADSPQYFKDMTDGLVRRAVKLLKRLYGDEATLLDLNTLVWNVSDRGRKEYVMPLKRKSTMPDGSPIPPAIQLENDELIDWFLNDYYAGIGGAKGAPKTYENTSGVRTQITKLVSNKYLKKVLNPPKENEDGYIEYLQFQERCKAEGHPYKINFDEALREGYIVTMSTAQGALRDLGKFLGYFIILQLQASVFRRPGNENNRTHNMLYIDEFQVYSNPGFADMLTQGRSYRVASHLATQAREQIGMGSGRDGKSFVALVSTNARNKIIYPGVSYDDAKYYSDEFGEFKNVEWVKSTKGGTLWTTIFNSQQTRQQKEEMKARFSPTDIIDRPFGEITYRLINKNNVAQPGVSKISYIPKEINDTLDKMIEADNAVRLSTSGAQDYAAALNISDSQLNANVDMYHSTLNVADPMVKMQEEQQMQSRLSGLVNEKQFVPKQPQPQPQMFEDAVYEEEDEFKDPTSFGDDIQEYNFDSLQLSPERQAQINNSVPKPTPAPAPRPVAPNNVVNPAFANGPQFVGMSTKGDNMEDLFGNGGPRPSTPQVKPPAPKPIQPPPIPAHTKTQIEQPKPKSPVVGHYVEDNDI